MDSGHDDHPLSHTRVLRSNTLMVRISSADIAQIGKRPPIEDAYDGTRIKIRVEGRLRSPLNTRQGWKAVSGRTKGHRNRASQQAGLALAIAVQLGWRYSSSTPKLVSLLAHVPRRMDADGASLRASLKGHVDGLRDAGLIHSDGPDCRHSFEYDQVADKHWHGVEITVELRCV